MSPCIHPESAPGTPAVARLSPRQAQAAVALARGATVTRVADSLDVHRSTIYSWFKSDRLFRAAVTELQRERYERMNDEMHEMEALAFTALRQILQDPEAPAGVRFRTAVAVLNRPSDSIGAEAWRLPYMESIGHTLDRRPSLADPFSFDAGRQIPDSTGDSPDEIRQNSTLGLDFDAPAALPPDPDSDDEQEDDADDEENSEDDPANEPADGLFVFHADMFRQHSTPHAQFVPGPSLPRRAGPGLDMGDRRSIMKAEDTAMKVLNHDPLVTDHPRDMSEVQLARIGVRVLGTAELRLQCTTCGETWTPREAPDGSVEDDYWLCPRRCNVS